MTLQEVLEEQIEKNQKNISFYREQLRLLPKGSLQSIVINGRKQYYLKYYNDQGKRIEKLVEREDLEIINSQIMTRNQIEKWLQELKEDIEVAEKTLQYILREKR